MKKNLSSLIIAALAFSASAQAQGPLDIFRSDATKQKLEQNAPSLRNHLKQRKAALEAWKAVSPRDLKQVTVTANVTAKNRAGIRELREEEGHQEPDARSEVFERHPRQSRRAARHHPPHQCGYQQQAHGVPQQPQVVALGRQHAEEKHQREEYHHWLHRHRQFHARQQGHVDGKWG